MEPYFSIIVPNYNNDKFIGRCIKSILDQTFKNWEIIVIDNLSTDRSKEIIKTFNDDRIRFYEVNNNGIIGKSRNIGINHSKGVWLSFLDSDDWWESDKLKKVYDIIAHNECEAVVHDEYKYFEIDNSIKRLKYGPFENNFFEKLLIYGNRISLSASSVRKDFLIKKDILFSEDKDHVTAEDYDFWLKIANNNGSFYFLKDILGYYFIHNNNYSLNNDKHIENVFNVSLSHSNSYKLNKYKNYILSRKYLSISLDNLSKRNFKSFIKNLNKSIQYSFLFIIFYLINKIKLKLIK